MNEGLGMDVRIVLVILYSILLIPLMNAQRNPEREHERDTLLSLIGLLGVLMILVRLLRPQIC